MQDLLNKKPKNGKYIEEDIISRIGDVDKYYSKQNGYYSKKNGKLKIKLNLYRGKNFVEIFNDL